MYRWQTFVRAAADSVDTVRTLLCGDRALQQIGRGLTIPGQAGCWRRKSRRPLCHSTEACPWPWQPQAAWLSCRCCLWPTHRNCKSIAIPRDYCAAQRHVCALGKHRMPVLPLPYAACTWALYILCKFIATRARNLCPWQLQAAWLSSCCLLPSVALPGTEDQEQQGFMQAALTQSPHHSQTAVAICLTGHRSPQAAEASKHGSMHCTSKVVQGCRARSTWTNQRTKSPAWKALAGMEAEYRLLPAHTIRQSYADIGTLACMSVGEACAMLCCAARQAAERAGHATGGTVSKRRKMKRNRGRGRGAEGGWAPVPFKGTETLGAENIRLSWGSHRCAAYA